MLGSHCKFSSIDSESHQLNKECCQVQTKKLHFNKVDDSFDDEVEHALFLVDYFR